MASGWRSPPTCVDYPVVLEHVAPRDLAVAWGSSVSQIISLLDQVWPVLRAQGVRTGHNVVVYFGPSRLAAGVEVPDRFAPTAQVQPFSTPSGEVATTVYWGDYTQMRPAYEALEAWFTAHHRQRAGVSWEVYADPDPDPARCRTDIFILLGNRGDSPPAQPGPL
jgi:GyrI-like small molecule binding domain